MIKNDPIDSRYSFQIKNTVNEPISSSGKFLFNQLAFLQQQTCASLLSFELWDKQQNRAVILLHISAHQSEAISPYRATFGGIEMADSLEAKLPGMFLTKVHQFLKAHGITLIRITNPPFAYDNEIFQQVTFLLLSHGYLIDRSELNYHIPIGNTSLEPQLHASEKRRLQKCRKAGFAFAEEQTLNLTEIYAFIAKARSRKGFPMSLTLQEFQQLFINLPGIYRIFTLRDGETITALTVTVRINSQILYNFYPSDNEHYLNYSPTVMLTVELYNLARREGYSMLDLGIATENGKPNYGLMRFKKNLGAECSLKLSFKKTLL